MNIVFSNCFECLSLAWQFASLGSGTCRSSSTDISHGSVATHFKRGGMFNYRCFIRNLPLSLPLKELSNRLVFGRVTGRSRVVKLFPGTRCKVSIDDS